MYGTYGCTVLYHEQTPAYRRNTEMSPGAQARQGTRVTEYLGRQPPPKAKIPKYQIPKSKRRQQNRHIPTQTRTSGIKLLLFISQTVSNASVCRKGNKPRNWTLRRSASSRVGVRWRGGLGGFSVNQSTGPALRHLGEMGCACV